MEHFFKTSNDFYTCRQTASQDPTGIYSDIVIRPNLPPRSRRAGAGSAAAASGSAAAALAASAATASAAASGSAAAAPLKRQRSGSVSSVGSQKSSRSKRSTRNSGPVISPGKFPIKVRSPLSPRQNDCLLPVNVNEANIRNKFHWPLPAVSDKAPYFVSVNKKGFFGQQGQLYLEGCDSTNPNPFVLLDSHPWSLLDSDRLEMCPDTGPRPDRGYEYVQDTKSSSDFQNFIGKKWKNADSSDIRSKEMRTLAMINVDGQQLKVIRSPVNLDYAFDAIDPRSRMFVSRGPHTYKIIINKDGDSKQGYNLNFGSQTLSRKPFNAFDLASTCLSLIFRPVHKSMEIHYLQLNPIFEVGPYISPTSAHNTKRFIEKTKTRNVSMLPEEIKFVYKNSHCAQLVHGPRTRTCETEFPSPSAVASAAASAAAGSAASAASQEFTASNWIALAKQMALHFKCLFIWLDEYMRTAWSRGMNYSDPNFQFICLCHYGIGITGSTKYEEYLGLKPLNRKRDPKGKPELIMHPGAYDFLTKSPRGYIKTKQFRHLPDKIRRTIQEMITDIRFPGSRSVGKPTVNLMKTVQSLDDTMISVTNTDSPSKKDRCIVNTVYKLYIENPLVFMQILLTNHFAELKDYALRVYAKEFLEDEKIAASIFLWWVVIKDHRSHADILQTFQADLHQAIRVWPLEQYNTNRKTPLEYLINFMNFDPYTYKYGTNTYDNTGPVTIESWENC